MPKTAIKLTRRKKRLKVLQRDVAAGKMVTLWSLPAADLIVSIIRKNWSGIYPPASVPGQPPAVRTGTLDMNVKRTKGPKKAYVVSIGSQAFYAPFLEFGTAKMQARPFVRPATEEAASDLDKMVIKAVNTTIADAIRRAGGV